MRQVMISEEQKVTSVATLVKVIFKMCVFKILRPFRYALAVLLELRKTQIKLRRAKRCSVQYFNFQSTLSKINNYVVNRFKFCKTISSLN